MKTQPKSCHYEAASDFVQWMNVCMCFLGECVCLDTPHNRFRVRSLSGSAIDVYCIKSIYKYKVDDHLSRGSNTIKYVSFCCLSICFALNVTHHLIIYSIPKKAFTSLCFTRRRRKIVLSLSMYTHESSPIESRSIHTLYVSALSVSLSLHVSISHSCIV